MKTILVFFFSLCIIGCASETKQNTIVSAHIKGLQKGTVYLQKIKDTAYVTLDSVIIKKDRVFEMDCNLSEPEVLFLGLSKENDAERISFFAHQNNTHIETTLKRFVSDAKIDGSAQQKLYEEYNANIIRFKDKDLELLENSLNAQRLGRDSILEKSENQRELNLKRQYLYTINFAVNNRNSEVAPYVALADIYDAKVAFLDTIYNSLTPKIAGSKYGVMLKEYLEQISSEK